LKNYDLELDPKFLDLEPELFQIEIDSTTLHFVANEASCIFLVVPGPKNGLLVAKKIKI